MGNKFEIITRLFKTEQGRHNIMLSMVTPLKNVIELNDRDRFIERYEGIFYKIVNAVLEEQHTGSVYGLFKKFEGLGFVDVPVGIIEIIPYLVVTDEKQFNER